MFDTGISSSFREQRYQMESQKYGPFKFVDPDQNPAKSAFQMESEMRTRNLSNIGRFYHNQNSNIVSNLRSETGQYPAGLIDSKEYYYQGSNIHPNAKIVESQIKKVPEAESGNQPHVLFEEIKHGKTNEQKKTGFGWKSCILIMVSLLILAILGGFLYLIFTNQLEKAKYFVMRKVGLWKNNKPQVFYGSSQNSHPVKDSVVKNSEPQQQKVKPSISLRKPSDQEKSQLSEKNNEKTQTISNFNETKVKEQDELEIIKSLNNTKSKDTSTKSTTKIGTKISPKYYTITQETKIVSMPKNITVKPSNQAEIKKGTSVKRNHKLRKD